MAPETTGADMELAASFPGQPWSLERQADYTQGPSHEIPCFLQVIEFPEAENTAGQARLRWLLMNAAGK